MRKQRRHLAIIDKGRPAILKTNHHEPAAAEITRRWMRHREGKRDRDRRVNSIAAAFHDLHADTGSDLVG